MFLSIKQAQIKDSGPRLGFEISDGYSLEQVSNEKSLGWLGYIGDYTTQLYSDYNKPL